MENALFLTFLMLPTALVSSTNPGLLTLAQQCKAVNRKKLKEELKKLWSREEQNEVRERIEKLKEKDLLDMAAQEREKYRLQKDAEKTVPRIERQQRKLLNPKFTRKERKSCKKLL